MSLNKFARNAWLLAFIILTVSTTAAAQTKSHSWIRGVWDGTGYQVDDKSTWPMTLIARGRTFSINYPSLSCGGHWKLISINSSRARFREVLDHGQDKCADKGSVLIQRLNRNQIVFLYSYAKTKEISASAVLNRRLDVSINGFRPQRLP
ncbi:MAG TPA: hypothetical protein VNG71_16875 [Pyrinomonadaceae bacterium]|nr:hypothetical protein [Pyrinomonadaceae bacterium]